MNIIVFEDAGARQLYPITTGRPAYAITCGSYRLIDWLAQLDGNLVGLVRPELETIQIHDFRECQSQLDQEQPLTWVINARAVPSVSNLKRLHDFKNRALANSQIDSTGVVARSGWAIASALLPTRLLGGQSPDQWRGLINQLADPGATSVDVTPSELKLFEYPHEVVDQHLKTLCENLEHRIRVGDFQQTQTDVHCGPGVTLGDYAVLDPSSGPIVIDANVTVGPFSLLRGPIYIGPNSRVNEYASVKDRVAISHHCKIGGEVEASVIEAYTNKQHHGFLGHSYLGCWINLGAGTSNSDLKNTYGTVNVEYGERKVSTGMQFLGCVIGDYAKTAINTSIFTGKMIGTASMVYGFATTNVPSFVNYARTFGELGSLPPEVVAATQGRMFARRNVKQRPCDVQLIHDMYRLTASERLDNLSNQPLSL